MTAGTVLAPLHEEEEEEEEERSCFPRYQAHLHHPSRLPGPPGAVCQPWGQWRCHGVSPPGDGQGWSGQWEVGITPKDEGEGGSRATLLACRGMGTSRALWRQHCYWAANKVIAAHLVLEGYFFW